MGEINIREEMQKFAAGNREEIGEMKSILKDIDDKKKIIGKIFDEIKIDGKKIDFTITNENALSLKIVNLFKQVILKANSKIEDAISNNINLDNIEINGISTSIKSILQKVVDSITLNGNEFNEGLIVELYQSLQDVDQMTKEITNRINGYNIDDFINGIQKIEGIEFISQKTINDYKKRISKLTITTEDAINDINRTISSELKFNRYQQTILSAINQNDISMLYDIEYDELGYDRLSKMFGDLNNLTENNSFNNIDEEISTYLINLKNSISRRIDYLDNSMEDFTENVWNNPLYEKYRDVHSINKEYNDLTYQVRNGWVDSSDALSRMNALLKDYDDNFDLGKIQERVNIINELNEALNTVKDILSSGTSGGFRENNNITESLNSISDSIDRLQKVFASINVDEFTDSLRSCFNMLNEFFNLLKTKDGTSNIFSDYIISFDSIINKLEIIRQKVGKSQFNYTYRQESTPNELAQKNKYNSVLSTELERYKNVYLKIIDSVGFENLIYELIQYSNSFKAQFEGNAQEAMDLFNIKSILDIQSTEAGALGSIQRIIDFLKYIDEALSNVAQIKTNREDIAEKIKNAKTSTEKDELNKLYHYLPNVDDFWNDILTALKNKAGQNRLALDTRRITSSLSNVAGDAENEDKKQNKIFKALEQHEKKLNKIDQENTPEYKYLENLNNIQNILQNIADILNNNLSQNINIDNIEQNGVQIDETFQKATLLLDTINAISEKINQMPDLNLFQNINPEEILTSVMSLIDNINSSLNFDEIIQKVQTCVNEINDILDQVKSPIEYIYNLIDNIPEEKNILIRLDLNQLQSDIDNYFNIIKTMGDIPISFNIGNNEVRTQANVLDPDDIKALEIIAKAIQDVPNIFDTLSIYNTNARAIQQLIQKGWSGQEAAAFDDALIKTGFMNQETGEMTFKNARDGAQHDLAVIGDKYVILRRGNEQPQRFDEALSNQKKINELVADGFSLAAMAVVKKVDEFESDSTKSFIEIQQRLPGVNHRKVAKKMPEELLNMPVENLAELFRQFNVILQHGLTGELGGDNLLYSNGKLFPIDLVAPGVYSFGVKDINDFKEKLYYSFSDEFSHEADENAFKKKIDEAYELFQKNPEPTFYRNKNLNGMEIFLTPELIEQWRQKIQQDLNKESLTINVSPILSDSFKSDIEKQLKGLNIGISLNPSGAFKNNPNKQNNNNNNIPSGIMLDENEFELPHIPTFADWILDRNLSGFTQEEKDFYEATGDISPKILKPIIEALEMGVIGFKDAYKELNLPQPNKNEISSGGETHQAEEFRKISEDIVEVLSHEGKTESDSDEKSEFLHVISTMNMGNLRNFTYEDNHLGRKVKVNGQINEQTGDFEETSRVISTNYKLIVSEAAKAQIQIEKINNKLANETDAGVRQALENEKSIYEEKFNNAEAAARFYANEISFNPLNAEFINDPQFYSQFLLDTFYKDVLEKINPELAKEGVRKEQNRARQDAALAAQEQMTMEAESEELAAQRQARYNNLVRAQKEAHDIVQAYKENEQINDKNKLFDAQKLKSLQSVLQYLDEIEIGNVSTQTLDQLTKFFDLIKNAQNAIQLKTVNTEFDIFKNNNTTNFKPDIIQNKKNELSQAVKEYETEIINARKNTIGFNIAIKNITELINGITTSDGITYAKQEFEKLKQNFPINNDQNFDLIKQVTDLYKYATNEDVRNEISLLLNEVAKATNETQINLVKENINNLKGKLLSDKNITKQLHGEKEQAVINKLIEIKKSQDDLLISELAGEDTQKIENIIKVLKEDLTKLQKEYDDFVEELKDFYPGNASIFDGISSSNIRIPQKEQEKIDQRIISKKDKIKKQRADIERKQNASLAKRNRRIDLLDRLKLKYTNDVDRPLNQGQINNINAIVNEAEGKIQKIFGSTENEILTDVDVAAIDNITKETILKVKQFMDGIYKSMEQAPVNLSAQIEKIRKMITDLSKLDKDKHYSQEIEDLYGEAMADIDAKTVKIIKNKVEALKSKLYSEKNITGLLSDSKNKITESRNKIYELKSQKRIVEIVDPESESISNIDEQIQKEEENLNNLKTELLNITNEILTVYKKINPNTKIREEIDQFIDKNNDIPDNKYKENVDKKEKNELDKEANEAYRKNLKIIKEIIDIYPEYISGIKQFDIETKKLITTFLSTKNKILNNEGLYKYGDKELESEVEERYKNFYKIITDNLKMQYDNAIINLDDIISDDKSTNKLKEFLNKLKNELKSFSIPNAIDDEWIRNNYANFIKLIDKIENFDVKPLQKADIDQVNNLRASVGQFLNENSLMPKKNKTDLNYILDQLKRNVNELTNDDLAGLDSKFKAIKADVYELGRTGKNAFGKLKDSIKNSLGNIVTQYLSFNDWIRYIREGAQAVIDLDNALVELKIISNEQSNVLSKVAQSAYELGNNIGFSTSEIIKSVTDWRRLGNSMSDSIILAEQAGRLATGGLMDVSTATSVLTSSMQAFEISAEDLNKVIDQYIYLGNNYAITSEDLATSLTKSVAALKTAGNSLEQIEALEVAGNTIMQDADTVSNALKVVSMRLRGTSGSALEEIGEETDGLIESASKLESKVKLLTKTIDNPDGISIVNKLNNSYKSTYQILLEISKVWDKIGDAQRSELLEIIAGKTRGSVVASLLESGDILESAYDDAVNNATGAGEQAIESSLTAAQKKIQILQNTLKYSTQQLIDTDMLKTVIDNVTELIKLFVDLAKHISPAISLVGNLFGTIVDALNVLPKELLNVGIFGMIFGNKINSQAKLFTDNINKITASINGIATEFNVKDSELLSTDVLQKYQLELSKATKQEQIYAINSSDLTYVKKEQLKQYLKTSEALQSLNGIEVKSILNSSLASEIDKEEILNKLKLSGANTDEYLSTKLLNKEIVIKTISESSLTEIEKAQMIQQVQNIATNTVEEASLKRIILAKKEQIALNAKYIASLIKQHPIITAILAVLSVLAKVYIDVKEANEKEQEAINQSITDLKTANEEVKQTIETLDDAISKYQEYSKILSDVNSTESDLYEARSNLYDIQKNIIGQFSATAQGIDLVNGSYEKELKLLEDIEKQSINTWLTNNSENYKNNVGKLNNPVTVSALLDNNPVNLSDEDMKYLSDVLSEFNIKQANLITSFRGTVSLLDDTFSWKGMDIINEMNASTYITSPYEYYQDMKKFQNWYREYRNTFDEKFQIYLDMINDTINSQMNDEELKFKDFDSIYEEAKKYEQLSAKASTRQIISFSGEEISISQLYENYISAYDKLSSAIASGKGIKEAWEFFNSFSLENNFSQNIIDQLEDSVIKAFEYISKDGKFIYESRNYYTDALNKIYSHINPTRNPNNENEKRLKEIISNYNIIDYNELLRQLEIANYNMDSLESYYSGQYAKKLEESNYNLDKFLNKESSIIKDAKPIKYSELINEVINQFQTAQDLINNVDLPDNLLWEKALYELIDENKLFEIKIEDFNLNDGTAKNKISEYVFELTNWIITNFKTDDAWDGLDNNIQEILISKINNAAYSALSGGEEWKNYSKDLEKIDFLSPYLDKARTQTALSDSEAQYLFDNFGIKSINAGTNKKYINSEDIISKYNEIVDAANNAATQIRRANENLNFDKFDKLTPYLKDEESTNTARKIYKEQGEEAVKEYISSLNYGLSFAHIDADTLIDLFRSEDIGQVVGENIAKAVIEGFNNSVYQSNWESKMGTAQGFYDRLFIGNDTVTKDEIINALPDFEEFFNGIGQTFISEESVTEAEQLIDVLFAYINNETDKTFATMVDESVSTYKYIEEKQNEFLTGSNKTKTLVNSFDDLYEVLNKVKSGYVFTTEEITELGKKYPDLLKSLKISGDGYKIQQDAVESLLVSYKDEANEAIASQLNVAKKTVEYCKVQIENFKITAEAVDLLRKSYEKLDSSSFSSVGTMLSKAMHENIIDIGQVNQILNDWTKNGKTNDALKQAMQGTPLEPLFSMYESEDYIEQFEEYLKRINTDVQGLGDTPTSIDWLTVKLQKLQEAVDNAKTAFDNLQYTTSSTKFYKEQLKALDVENQALEAQKEGFDIAAQEYERRFKNGVPGSKATVSDSVLNDIKNGKRIDIELYDSDMAEAINTAIENYNNMNDAKKNSLEVEMTLKANNIEAEKILRDSITERFDKILAEYENRQNVLEHGISMVEAQGYMNNENYLKTLVYNETQTLEAALTERKLMVDNLSKIDTSTKAGQDLWDETYNSINDITSAIYESEEAILDYKNQLQQLSWDLNDKIREVYTGITNETSFFDSILSNKELYQNERETLWGDSWSTKLYNGKLSKEGMSALGLYNINLKTYQENAQEIGKELKKINKDLANDPANIKLLDRRNELLSQQHDAILAAEEEKQKIIELCREGYDKQLESMQTLIDKYMEALNAEKDLYDYQKNVEKQTKDIAKLRKQIAAYATDASEEAKAKVQQLKIELEEAEENLNDTEYDRYLSDQQDMLSDIYEEYSAFINERLENTELVLKEMEQLVNENTKDIKKTLSSEAKDLGIKLSDSLKNILNTPLSEITSIKEMVAARDMNISAIQQSVTSWSAYLTKFLEDYNLTKKNIENGNKDSLFDKLSDAVSSLDTNLFGMSNNGYIPTIDLTLKDIKQYVKSLAGDKDGNDYAPRIYTQADADKIDAAIQMVKDYAPSFVKNILGMNDSSTITSSTLKSASSTNAINVPLDPKKHGYNEMFNWLINHDFPTPGQTNENGLYKNSKLIDGKLIYATDKDKNMALSKWIQKYLEYKNIKFNAYATGSKKIKEDEFAWTQENGMEAIIRPTDNAILTPLKRGDSVLTADKTKNIWDMASNPMKFIKDNLTMPLNISNVVPVGKNSANVITNQMQIILPNVQNYNEFVSALQKDKKFEAMIQDMTINRLSGGSQLAKNKYKF